MKSQSIIHLTKGLTMTKKQASETNETENSADPIEVVYQGECLSISGRSKLSFAIGRIADDKTLHLAITSNSGSGMWCEDWAPASAIQDVVLGEGELTAKSFHELHPGKSINTGGFVLAALKELGLIRANENNTRVHEHVPTTTFEKVAMVRISGAATEPIPNTKRRKANGEAH
jgi:hypothetical protein